MRGVEPFPTWATLTTEVQRELVAGREQRFVGHRMTPTQRVIHAIAHGPPVACR